MSGECDLKTLLSSMKPKLQDGVFVFCALSYDQELAPNIKTIGRFDEEEGRTFFMRKE